MFMMKKSFLDEVLFVVVLYRKSAEESPSIRFLTTSLSLLPSLYVYDNSPQQQTYPPHAIYVHDPANRGVSRAYNEANKLARSLGKKWMMLLDQDTALDEDFLTMLSSTVDNHPEAVLFAPLLIDRRGMVSPFRWNATTGTRISRVGSTLNLKYFRFQNSGLLVSTEAFARVNGYNESIGLDFSDIAFGERMRKLTDKFVVVNYRLHHGFSETGCMTTDSALQRYTKFCEGAFVMGRTLGIRWQFYLRALARGLKLTWRHKDTSFIKTFFTTC